MYKSVLQSGDKELYSYCLLLDLTKGFHTVDHTIFILKEGFFWHYRLLRIIILNA